MKVIYLVQGDAKAPLYDFPPQSDYLYLQWQADFVPMEKSFHFPGSSWASGRNELYRRARIQGPYDYYIFMDDDVLFDLSKKKRRCFKNVLKLAAKLRLRPAFRFARSFLRALKSEQSLAEFERLLGKHGSLIGVPRLWGHGWSEDYKFAEVDAVSCADACMVAVHHSVADRLLPYSTEYDDVNWWFCGEVFFEKATKFCWGRIHRFSNFHIWNLQNREYPKDKSSWIVNVNQTGEAVRSTLLPAVPEVSPESEIGDNSTIVVTSIQHPTDAMRSVAAKCAETHSPFIMMGDRKSPADFQLQNCDFWSSARQGQIPGKLKDKLPENHYARKNLGYLAALQNSETRFIIETDDDNDPLGTFWKLRSVDQQVDCLRGNGWINTYNFFSDANVWPRGFPLENIHSPYGAAFRTGADTGGQDQPTLTREQKKCYIQQGLVQHDPDVDAIFRQTQKGPVWFRDRDPIYLEPGLWCPFNSQNTTWSVDVAELMYLPSHCVMRETDIWRSFIAQRVLWTLESGVMFHAATMLQVRNAHDIRQDFEEEKRLYSMTATVTKNLEDLHLKPGFASMGENLMLCYEEMVRVGIFPKDELSLVSCWLDDVAQMRAS